MLNFDIYNVSTPCYVVDEVLLKKNLEKLAYVREKTGCKILLAQKAFSMYSVYPLISEYLDGTTASGLHEAMLGSEYMGNREVHIYSPAYKKKEMPEITRICDHIVFNTFEQLKKFKADIEGSGRNIKCGVRLNPEYSEIETDIYNPCITGSRMGTRSVDESQLDSISGFHFHTMCEQNSDTFERTVNEIEKKFGRYFNNMEWLNFGGGHHITREDYDIQRLIRVIDRIMQKYSVQVYLEPGEAVALNAGFLVTEVLDTMKNGIDIAIIDASAACHMPDVLEMPYRPNIIGAGRPNEKPYTYRLGAATCLAGDIIGDYSFDRPLKAGDRLVLCDMAIYSMCKNNTFNGINLPSIYFNTEKEGSRLIRSFGYEDFKSRL